MKNFFQAFAIVATSWIISIPVGLLLSTFWLHDVSLPIHATMLVSNEPFLTLIAVRTMISALIPCGVGLWLLYARKVLGAQKTGGPLLVTLGIAIIQTGVFVTVSLYFAHRLASVGLVT